MVTSEDSPPLNDVTLHGSVESNQLELLAIPGKYTNVLEGMPSGLPLMWVRCIIVLVMRYVLETRVSRTLIRLSSYIIS